MTYTVILLFWLSTAHLTTITIKCPDAGCVIEALEHARSKPSLSRLRVFDGEDSVLKSGKSIFEPLIDEMPG